MTAKKKPQEPHVPATGISAAAAEGASGASSARPQSTATSADVSAGKEAAGHAQPQSECRIDPAQEREFWRAHYAQRPYAQDIAYDELAPAYEHGWQSYERYARSVTGEPARFEDLEPQLRSDWEAEQRDKRLAWEVAQQATRDAWERVRDAMLEEPAKPSAR